MIAKEKFLNNSLSYLYKQIRKVYLNSNIYNRKISRVFDGGLNYVPNLSLLNCIIKSKERNFRIEDFSLEDVWNKIDLNDTIIHKQNIIFSTVRYTSVALNSVTLEKYTC